MQALYNLLFFWLLGKSGIYLLEDGCICYHYPHTKCFITHLDDCQPFVLGCGFGRRKRRNLSLNENCPYVSWNLEFTRSIGISLTFYDHICMCKGCSDVFIIFLITTSLTINHANSLPINTWPDFSQDRSMTIYPSSQDHSLISMSEFHISTIDM